jgi:hypothetical protein
MQAPTIHLNGSSPDSLIEENLAALRALQAAVEALQAASPNGRDYYVSGPEAYPQARKEHEARLHRLAETMRELAGIIAAIADQMEAREAVQQAYQH